MSTLTLSADSLMMTRDIITEALVAIYGTARPMAVAEIQDHLFLTSESHRMSSIAGLLDACYSGGTALATMVASRITQAAISGAETV